MPDYFLAPAGLALWREVRESGRWPDRDTASDGWIGDASHEARTSDHNPCWDCSGTSYGIVRAVDLDVDGWPATQVRDFILARCRSGVEKRLSYVINNRTIWSRTFNWVPRSYTGENPHLTHIHFSLVHDATNFDPAVWLPGYEGEGGGTPIDPPTEEDEMITTLVQPGERVRLVVGPANTVGISHDAPATDDAGAPIEYRLYVDATDANDDAYKPEQWARYYDAANELNIPSGRASVASLKPDSKTVGIRNDTTALLTVSLWKS